MELKIHIIEIKLFCEREILYLYLATPEEIVATWGMLQC
jgi:hypothetical protein